MASGHEPGREHIVLFVGDGMQLEHELAGSRYLYGQDFALAWHDWGAMADSWVGHGQQSNDGPDATAPRAFDDVTPSGSPDGLVDRGIVDLAETGCSDILLDNAI